MNLRQKTSLIQNDRIIDFCCIEQSSTLRKSNFNLNLHFKHPKSTGFSRDFFILLWREYCDS
jgi:hypothetical protein